MRVTRAKGSLLQYGYAHIERKTRNNRDVLAASLLESHVPYRLHIATS